MLYVLVKHEPKEGAEEKGMIRVKTMDTGQTLWVTPDEVIEKPFTEWGSSSVNFRGGKVPKKIKVVLDDEDN